MTIDNSMTTRTSASTRNSLKTSASCSLQIDRSLRVSTGPSRRRLGDTFHVPSVGPGWSAGRYPPRRRPRSWSVSRSGGSTPILPVERHQEARPAALAVSPSQADIDRNGEVNILDAFTLARHIESRQPLSQLWDLNGDGLVDRRDVDTIAMAAVRLNKGV